MAVKTTLPTSSEERKKYPILRGCIRYFPAALAGVSRISRIGNDKHNPGQEMHHARGKSGDHGDCVVRHVMDTEDLLAAMKRGGAVDVSQLLDEVDQMAWRALAFSQELHERFGAPLAPGARDDRGLALKRVAAEVMNDVLPPHYSGDDLEF